MRLSPVFVRPSPQFVCVGARSLRCELHWGTVLQAAVRTLFVVVPLPLRDLLPRIGKIAEPVLVQALVTKAPVETLHVAVLHRSSGSDRVPLQALLVGPLIDSTAHELGSVVAADLPRQSASLLQLFQYAHHSHSTQ